DVDINVFGPITRSADDLDLLLDVLAVPSLPTAKTGDLRVGVWFDEPACTVARDYRALLVAAADRLADAGAQVSEAHPPVDGVERSFLENTSWTGLIGIVGLPSAVPPIGRTPDGLPVGVQCVTRFHGDRTAIEVARRLGAYEPPPGF